MTKLREDAITTQNKKKKKTKQRYDRKNKAKFAFSAGDKVKLKTRNIQGKHGALGKPYKGPFNITNVNYPNVTIELDGKQKTFHTNLLQPFTISTISLIFTLIFSFILSLAVASEHKAPLVEPIYEKTGLHYNHLGKIGNHNSDWTFVVHFDIDIINRKIKTVERLTRELKTHGMNMNGNLEETLLQSLQERYQNMVTSMEKLFSRQKRQVGLAFAAGASALSFIIGLTSSTGYSTNQLQHDQAILRDLAQRQIQIVNSTVRNFNTEMNRFGQNFDTIDRTLRNITTRIRLQGADIVKMNISTEQNLMKTALLEIYDQVTSEILALQDAILLSK